MTTLMTDAVGSPMEVPTAPGVGVAPPGAGATFAAQLGQALGRLGEWQLVAARVPGLQATALSPGLQVLTPVDAVTDLKTLADFAKSQGIDESAVKWLFQGDVTALPAGSAQPALAPAVMDPLAVTTMVGSAGVEAKLPSGEPVLDPAVSEAEAAQTASMTPAALMLQRNQGAAQVPSVAAVGAARAETNVPSDEPVLNSEVSEAGAAQAVSMTPAVLMLQRNQGAAQTPSATVAPDPSTVSVAQRPSSDAWLTSTHAQVSHATKPQGQESAEGTDTTKVAELATLAVWIHERWGGEPQRSARAEAVDAPSDPAYGLSQVNKEMRPELAALVQKMVAAQDSGQRKALTTVDVLELDAELQADLRNWLDDGAIESMPAESRSSTPATASLAVSPQATFAKTDMAAQTVASASNTAERAENLQALAQRVGQAIGQRLVSMIERGHWNVKFMLKPRQLGEIEVDLRMRSGELDAAFRATNAFTRELLQDGLPRLREVMSSIGMDVASVHVGNGQAQRHGGNPTPPFKTPKGGQAVSDTGSGAASPQASVHVARQGGNGWDVMV